MSVNALAQQPAPDRTFEDMLGVLPREDMRLLMKGTLGATEKSALVSKLGEILNAKERGKKWTFRFTRSKGGNLYDTNKAGTEFYATVGDNVRVNGISYEVSLRVRITPALQGKVKECGVGRKIFISGTVDSAGLLMSNIPILSLHVTADDLGRGKG